MSDTGLAGFLLARIAEDEEKAVEADWRGRLYDGAWQIVDNEDGEIVATVSHEHEWSHIARHDPARVLAECEAKRQIVERCELVIQAFEDGVMWSNVNRRERTHARLTLRTFAGVYADHPDYREEWV